MTALKMSPLLTFSEYLTYQLPYKEYIITILKFGLFVLPVNFWTFWCKPRDFVADDCKIMAH